MGSRHNRKRTRSRPRNRKNLSLAASNPQMLFWPTSQSWSPSPFSPITFDHPPVPTPLHQHQPVLSSAQWHQRVQHQQRLQSERHEAAMEDERLRMFGGEKGDPVSLCAPMLQVVMDLFEGNVDYEDP